MIFIYHSRLETSNLAVPKPRGLTIVNGGCINAIQPPFTIVKPRGLSRWPNSKFQAGCGIGQSRLIPFFLLESFTLFILVSLPALRQQMRAAPRARVCRSAWSSGPSGASGPRRSHRFF